MISPGFGGGGHGIPDPSAGGDGGEGSVRGVSGKPLPFPGRVGGGEPCVRKGEGGGVGVGMEEKGCGYRGLLVWV